MFRDASGRIARNIDEAEAFIYKFIAENQASLDSRVHDRSHGYDLFLPWLMEVVENIHVPDEDHPPAVTVLDELYMEAAWSLVVKGYLRPGTRKVTGENAKDGYGKGFAVTRLGAQRVAEERVEPVVD
jgi:hypothetical protein